MSSSRAVTRTRKPDHGVTKSGRRISIFLTATSTLAIGRCDLARSEQSIASIETLTRLLRIGGAGLFLEHQLSRISLRPTCALSEIG
jgi:hypothetical protein